MTRTTDATLATNPYDPATIFYGPHPCERCERSIVKVSREQGGAEYDAPAEPIYPNTPWTQHVCGAAVPAPPVS